MSFHLPSHCPSSSIFYNLSRKASSILLYDSRVPYIGMHAQYYPLCFGKSALARHVHGYGRREGEEGEGEEQEGGGGGGGKRRLRPCSSRTSLPYLAMPLTCIPSYDINIPTYVATCTYRASACMLRAHLPLQVRGYGRGREKKEVEVCSLDFRKVPS